MVDEINLRNSIYRHSFRFEVTPRLWKSLYNVSKEGKARNLVTVKRNGVLKGYAAYLIFVRNQLTAMSILDMSADGEDTLAELIERIIQHGKAEGVDLIYFRKTPGSEDNIFDEKGFISFVESVIMVALFNPKELLSAFSQDKVSGTDLRVSIEGFEPITVKVSKKGIKVVSQEKHDLEVFTDSETFLRLFFGKTTFFKQYLKRKVKVSNILKLMAVYHFFRKIRQEKWHIPFGDWA